MLAIGLVFGVALGLVVALLIARGRASGSAAVLAARLDELGRVRSERDAALSELGALRASLSDQREECGLEVAEVRSKLAAANTELATAQTELRKEREAHEERLRELRDGQERLDERVKAALTGALGDSNKSLVALARAELGKERTELKRGVDLEQRKLGEMFTKVTETLGKVGGRLDEIEKDRIAAREQLDAQLNALRTSHGELLAGTQALVGALRRPHVRGRWGEIQLRNVVEAAGMLPHVDFDEQPGMRSDDGLLRPDACVHLPGQRDVVIDAKVPLEAYMEAVSVTDPEEQERLLGEHARHVRQHLRSLDSKGYWERLPCSPDFVVMFVPNDELLLAAMRADRSLAEEVQKGRVVIATPMNLMALLRIIALGWRQETLAVNAREVERLGRDLHKRLGVFASHLQSIGKKLGTLVKSYNEAIGSFERSVMPGARRFGELGAVPADARLPEGETVALLPREVQIHEAEQLEAPPADDAGADAA